MLTKRLPVVAVALASSALAAPAVASVHLESNAVRQLEHDSGVAWVALIDAPTAGTGYYLRPARPAEPWLASGEDPAHGAMRFFGAYGGIFQMVDPAHELKVIARGGGQGAQAAFFTQVEGGVPVAETGISMEFDGSGRIQSITGTFLPHLHGFRTTHALTPASAKAIAHADMARRFPTLRRAGPAGEPAPELSISAGGRSPRLVYKLTLDYADAPSAMSYLVDANSGAVVEATAAAAAAP
jgi:hypothetical protein